LHIKRKRLTSRRTVHECTRLLATAETRQLIHFIATTAERPSGAGDGWRRPHAINGTHYTHVGAIWKDEKNTFLKKKKNKID